MKSAFWGCLVSCIIAGGCARNEAPISAEPSRELFLGRGVLPSGDQAPEAALGGQLATFRSFWPNTDGNTWTYNYEEHFAADTMVAALDGLESVVGEAIDFRDLERRLLLPLPEPSLLEDSTVGTFQMSFNGMINTPFAGPKQKLEMLLTPNLNVTPGTPSGLMRRIYLARPDLRSKMIAKGLIPSSYSPGDIVANVGPILVGAPYEYFDQRDTWMGYYGDLNADSSFTIIQAPLERGAAFQHQLVPDLADDIWEYGWIVGSWGMESPSGRYRSVVRSVYFIDFGLSVYVDQNGNKWPPFRSYSIALLDLASGVGPVWQRSLDYLSPPIPEIGIEHNILFNEMRLTDRELADAAIVAREQIDNSW